MSLTKLAFHSKTNSRKGSCSSWTLDSKIADDELEQEVVIETGTVSAYFLSFRVLASVVCLFRCYSWLPHWRDLPIQASCLSNRARSDLYTRHLDGQSGVWWYLLTTSLLLTLYWWTSSLITCEVVLVLRLCVKLFQREVLVFSSPHLLFVYFAIYSGTYYLLIKYIWRSTSSAWCRVVCKLRGSSTC